MSLPALDINGNALWPARYSAKDLIAIRDERGHYHFESQYMQDPRTRCGALFADTHFYDELPKSFRIGKGIDIAYAAKTRSDKSAGVVMVEDGGIFYVVNVLHVTAKVPEFMGMLATVDTQWPGPWHWFASSTESGLAELASATAGVSVISERAALDKFQRAQGVAAAWNRGLVRLPRRAAWLDSFVGEICGFVGVGDRHDDQVDALSSAFTRLGGTAATMRGARPQAFTPIASNIGQSWNDMVQPTERERSRGNWPRTPPTLPTSHRGPFVIRRGGGGCGSGWSF